MITVRRWGEKGCLSSSEEGECTINISFSPVAHENEIMSVNSWIVLILSVLARDHGKKLTVPVRVQQMSIYLRAINIVDRTDIGKVSVDSGPF